MSRTCSTRLTLEHREALLRVWDRGILTEGPETDELEREFARWLGVEDHRIVAVSSGTAALSALLLAYGIGPGDEVIVPAFTFTATALAVLRVGAEPVFADVDRTWGLSFVQVEKARTKRTKAVIGVDLHGVPAKWNGIYEVADDLVVIEDACPAYGATFDGVSAGLLGREGAAFSLNESKQLPAGEGGLVVVPDAITSTKVRALRRFGEIRAGETKTTLRRSEVAGDNWKITEASAALARAGLPGLRDRIYRAQVAGALIRKAAEEVRLEVHPTPWQAKPSWFKIRLGAKSQEAAERISRFLSGEGVPIRGGEVAPLPLHPIFRDSSRLGLPFERAFESRKTFCVGSRTEPIFEADYATARRWAELIGSLPSELLSP